MPQQNVTLFVIPSFRFFRWLHDGYSTSIWFLSCSLCVIMCCVPILLHWRSPKHYPPSTGPSPVERQGWWWGRDTCLFLRCPSQCTDLCRDTSMLAPCRLGLHAIDVLFSEPCVFGYSSHRGDACLFLITVTPCHC